MQEVQEEGKNAIDSPGNPMAPTLPPEEYALGNYFFFFFFCEFFSLTQPINVCDYDKMQKRMKNDPW